MCVCVCVCVHRYTYRHWGNMERIVAAAPSPKPTRTRTRTRTRTQTRTSACLGRMLRPAGADEISISWISFIGYLGVLIGYVSYPKIVQEDSTNLIILFINNQIFDITNRGKRFLIFVIIFSSLVFISLIINLNPLFITI